MELRPYQEACVCGIYDFLRTRPGNPVAVIPTGGGKTPVIARIAHDAVTKWGGRVLILAHVKELLQQAERSLKALAPDLPIGVYSAGLGRKEGANTRRGRLKGMDDPPDVLIAGVQSIFNKACDFDPFNLVIIDEAHLIPPEGDGMYRTLLTDLATINPRVRCIGLTATPYRMSSGFIYGDDAFLTDVAYEIGVRELVTDGYLSPLISKRGAVCDTSGLHVRAGEFIEAEAEALMMENVAPAVDELMVFTAKRKSVLVFCTGIAHATEVANRIARTGFDVRCVFGDTPADERAEYLDQFKAGALKYLVNVNVLTTGFDAPNVDCVALLRPTLSPGLYYQMVGRGFRLAKGKDNCLILDFGGNVETHGPVDEIKVKGRKGPRNEKGDPPAKTCPQCLSIVSAGYAECPDCGYLFPPGPGRTHEATATDAPVMSTEPAEPVYEDLEVIATHYTVWEKRNAPPGTPTTMRVEYQTGCGQWRSEWICFEHTGYALGKAKKWWSEMSDEEFPESTAEAVRLANSGYVKEVVAIRTKLDPGKEWPEIVNREIGDYPPKLPTLEDAAPVAPSIHQAALPF